jgi:hypothetical protein
MSGFYVHNFIRRGSGQKKKLIKILNMENKKNSFSHCTEMEINWNKQYNYI